MIETEGLNPENKYIDGVLFIIPLLVLIPFYKFLEKVLRAGKRMGAITDSEAAT